MKKQIIFNLLALFLVASCTVQKRVYNNGYHIVWNSKQKVSKESSIASDKAIDEKLIVKNEDEKNTEILNSISENSNINEEDVDNEKEINIKSEKTITSKNEEVKPSLSINHIKRNTSNKTFNNKNELLKKIAQSKIKTQIKKYKSIDLGDLVVKILLIILILILISLLLSLLGGLLGGLLSLILLILLIILILKLIGTI